MVLHRHAIANHIEVTNNACRAVCRNGKLLIILSVPYITGAASS